MRSPPLLTGAFRTSLMSPLGGLDIASLGIRRFLCLFGSSCKPESQTTATGPIGGVIAILYARNELVANACSEAGLSSHFVKSRTIAHMSWALWYQLTPAPRTAESAWLPITMNIGTRSAYAL